MTKLFLIAFLLSIFALTACSEKVTVEDNDDAIGEEAIQMIMPQDGKAVHPKFGVEEWFAFGPMSGVGDTPANGVAQAYVFENGSYTLTMQLNIIPAADGTFYEAWLSGDESDDLVSAGHLANHFGDARHQLKFESEEDFRALLQVRVTLELDDGNPTPSTDLVAQGMLRPTQR
ncbi:anti-sigma factor [Patescibacteria group bacterium]|nr:anti-sigma factor [Patescibacteria group bacterium]